MPLGIGLHVLPVGDLIDHETQSDCVCGPSIRYEVDAEEPQTINIVFTHHSLDGRERRAL